MLNIKTTFVIVFVSGISGFIQNYKAEKSIEALQNMPEQMEKHIEKILKDKDPDVRIFAINILESLKHKDVPKWLLETALNDDHVNVVATALDALTELVTPDMKDDLKKIQQKFKDEPYINFVINSMLEGLEE